MIINGHSHDMNTQSMETLGWRRGTFADRKRLLDIKIQEAVKSIEISNFYGKVCTESILCVSGGKTAFSNFYSVERGRGCSLHSVLNLHLSSNIRDNTGMLSSRRARSCNRKPARGLNVDRNANLSPLLCFSSVEMTFYFFTVGSKQLFGFICQSVISWLMLIPDSTTFEVLLNYFTFFGWLGYGASISSILWLRYKRPNAVRPYKVKISRKIN